MEADMAASMLKQHEENNSENVVRLVMDNDSTTTAKLRAEVKHEIEDIKDINHTEKKLGTHLYNLQVKHKALTPKVIGYLQKCFAYVLTRHRDDTDGIRKGLLNITNHGFGCHEECEETWCGYRKSPNTYKHANLPYGRDLSGEELRADLQKLFRVYAENVNLRHWGVPK